MAEISTFTFSYKELATILVKSQNLHEGIWGIAVRFGLKATNIGESENDLRPAAVLPLLEISLQRFDKETNISVDAAKVNPGAHDFPSRRGRPH